VQLVLAFERQYALFTLPFLAPAIIGAALVVVCLMSFGELQHT